LEGMCRAANPILKKKNPFEVVKLDTNDITEFDTRFGFKIKIKT
jgi:hypothetical protein